MERLLIRAAHLPTLILHRLSSAVLVGKVKPAKRMESRSDVECRMSAVVAMSAVLEHSRGYGRLYRMFDSMFQYQGQSSRVLDLAGNCSCLEGSTLLPYDRDTPEPDTFRKTGLL